MSIITNIKIEFLFVTLVANVSIGSGMGNESYKNFLSFHKLFSAPYITVIRERRRQWVGHRLDVRR
jgi:hypothetical protein